MNKRWLALFEPNFTLKNFQVYNLRFKELPPDLEHIHDRGKTWNTASNNYNPEKSLFSLAKQESNYFVFHSIHSQWESMKVVFVWCFNFWLNRRLTLLISLYLTNHSWADKITKLMITTFNWLHNLPGQTRVFYAVTHILFVFYFWFLIFEFIFNYFMTLNLWSPNRSRVMKILLS